MIVGGVGLGREILAVRHDAEADALLEVDHERAAVLALAPAMIIARKSLSSLNALMRNHIRGSFL